MKDPQNTADFRHAKTAVLLVNFNTSSHTLRCVESLADGTISPLIVIVDNGSSEADYHALLQSESTVIVIRSNENLGFGRGNNLGIEWILNNTKCRYVFVLNNDTYVEDDSVQILESYLDDNETVGACTPRIMMAAQEDRYWYGGGSLNWWRGGARSWRFMLPFDHDLKEQDVSFMTGCAMFLRRELLEDLGGFDPRFFMYCEDWELSARIAESNWDMRYIPISTIYHEGHASISERESGYESPLDSNSPSLDFYLTNVVAGSLLAARLSAGFAQWVGGVCFLTARWTKWAFRYAIDGRWDALASIRRGVTLYRRMHKQPATELTGPNHRPTVTLPRSNCQF